MILQAAQPALIMVAAASSACPSEVIETKSAPAAAVVRADSLYFTFSSCRPTSVVFDTAAALEPLSAEAWEALDAGLRSTGPLIDLGDFSQYADDV